MRSACLGLLLCVSVFLTPPLCWAGSVEGLAARTFQDRFSAYQELVDAKQESLDDLIGGTEDERLLVRMYCVRALGEIGDEAAFDAILRVAKEDANSAIRAEAAVALGRLGTDAAANALLDIIGVKRGEDAESAIRAEAAGAPQAKEDKGDEVRYVRLCAAEGLCRFRSNYTVPLIISLLKHPDDDMPPLAAKALADLTYFHYGADYSRWKEWWQNNKETFDATQTVRPHLSLEKQ